MIISGDRSCRCTSVTIDSSIEYLWCNRTVVLIDFIHRYKLKLNAKQVAEITKVRHIR